MHTNGGRRLFDNRCIKIMYGCGMIIIIIIIGIILLLGADRGCIHDTNTLSKSASNNVRRKGDDGDG